MNEKALTTQAERFYPGNVYLTPDDTKRSIRDIITFGSRWSFYISYFSVVFRLWLKARKNKLDYDYYTRISNDILKAVESHRGRLNIEGLDNIMGSDEPYVIIGNHISSLEAQTLAAMLNTRTMSYVMKESLLTTPFFGPIMRSVYPIPVTRTNPIEDLNSILENGSEYLKKGHSVIIFPQGTRTPVFKTKQFNKMGVRLALKAGVSCIPLAVKTDYWGNGRLLKTFGPTHPEREVFFSFGEPIKPEGRGRKAHEEIVAYIAEKLRSWGAPVEES